MVLPFRNANYSKYCSGSTSSSFDRLADRGFITRSSRYRTVNTNEKIILIRKRLPLLDGPLKTDDGY